MERIRLGWPDVGAEELAAVAAVIEMVRDGRLPQQGFLKQEEIPLAPYLKTRTGNYYEIGHRRRNG